MYTPVPLLVLLALLAAAFSLVPSPRAQVVVHTLLVATLAASVLHLQARAGARIALLAVPAVFLVCATLSSFVPRLAPAAPVLFLACIVATLGTTACLYRRAALPPSPASSDTSFEKPPLSPRRTSLLLFAQLSYALATAFCIPPAIHPSGPPPPLVVFLVSVPHLSPTLVFRILDTAFTVLALLFVCAAYYRPSRPLACHLFFKPRFLPCATTSTTPPPPPPLLLSPLRLPHDPAPRSPVLVTPPPLVCKRAWSWHTPTQTPAPENDLASASEHEEGDFRDLRDPFAPVPAPPPPSAYRRWAAVARPRCSSYDSSMPPPLRPPTRMSTWGRLPPSPSPSPQRVRFGSEARCARVSPMRPRPRPRTPPPPPPSPLQPVRRQATEQAGSFVDDGARVREDALIAQRLLVSLSSTADV